jgi:hypothetical protein
VQWAEYSCHVQRPRGTFEEEIQLGYGACGGSESHVCWRLALGLRATARMVENGGGWLAWGLSPSGLMANSTAVIGELRTEGQEVAATVSRYDMSGYRSADVRLSPPEEQSALVNATVTVDSLGHMALTFGWDSSQSASSWVLWAYSTEGGTAADGGLWYHTASGSLQLDSAPPASSLHFCV